MRNFRKVIALVLAVAMMLTTFTTSFAAEKTSAEKLYDLGLLTGITASELGATLTRDKGIAMVLKALGFSQEKANAYVPKTTDPFTDTAGWVKGFAVKAYDDGITTGKTATLFKPLDPMSQKEFVTFLLRALGYDKTAAWTDTEKLAKSAGLADLLDDKTFTKDDAASVMFKALSAKTAGGTGAALFTTLGIDNAKLVAAGLVPATFSAVGLEPLTNLKVATITFTGDVDDKTVDKDTLKVYTKDSSTALTVDTASSTTGAAKYIVDGKTIKVVFKTALAQSDKVKVVIEKVKGKDGTELAKVEFTGTVTDVTAPSVKSVEVENAKTIKVTMSEPVNYAAATKVFDDVKIDTAKLVGAATVSDDFTVITYVLNTALAANTYTFTMESTTDFAGFKAPASTHTISVVADNAAPKVVSAEATGKDTVVIMFDEKIVNNAGKIKIGTTPAVEYSIVPSMVDGKKVTITLTSPLVASDAFVPVQCSYTGVKDVVGNEEKATPNPTFTFKAVFDEAAPTATVEVTKDNDIKVTFSEDVTGFTTAAVELKTTDSTPKAVSVASVTADGTSKKVYLIKLTTPGIDATNYTLKLLKDKVTDLSVIANKFAEATFTVSMKDKKAPTASAGTIVDTNKFRVVFSEAMDTATLADKNNYLVMADGTVKSLSQITDATVTAAADAKSVDIYAPKLGTSFVLLNLKDAAGTLLAAADYNVSKNIAAATAFAAANINTVKAKDAKTIEVVLKDSSAAFGVVDPNSFKILNAEATIYVQSATLDAKDSRKLTLTLSSDLKANATTGGAALALYTAGDKTKDTFGSALTIAAADAVAIADTIKATIKVASEAKETLTLTFDETVGSTTGATAVIGDIVLKDKDGVVVDLGGKIAVTKVGENYGSFTVLTITGLKGDETYTVEVISRNIKDAAGNVTAALAVTSQKIKND